MKKLFTVFILQLFVVSLWAQGALDSVAKTIACLRIGEKAPVFTAVNQNGGMVSMNKYRNRKNVLLMFYSDKIYSNPESPLRSEGQTQIQELVNAASNLKSKDIEVIMVTPDSQKDIFEMMQNTGATFSFVYDNNHELMDAYKCSYQVPFNHPEVKMLTDAGIKLPRKSTENFYSIPVPVMYLVGRDGVIKAVFNGAKMDDYRKDIGSEKTNAYTWEYISSKLNDKQ